MPCMWCKIIQLTKWDKRQKWQGTHAWPLSAFFIFIMSEEKKIIAIDAMGGDKGPNAVLGGMNQFLYQNGENSISFRLFGDEKNLRKLLAKYPRVARNVEVVHAPGVIKGTDKVMDVLRHAQDTSMYMAIKDVRLLSLRYFFHV